MLWNKNPFLLNWERKEGSSSHEILCGVVSLLEILLSNNYELFPSFHNSKLETTFSSYSCLNGSFLDR